jgi:transcription initiation factor TFIIB
MVSTALLITKYKKKNDLPKYSDNNNIFPIGILQSQNIDKAATLPRTQNTTTTTATTTSTSAPICRICNTDKAVITDPESGEIICRNCGAVISDKIEEIDHDWFSFSAEEISNKTRTGAPTSLARHDGGLYTVIGLENRDAAGNQIDTTMRSKMEKLRFWDARTQANSFRKRGLRQAFSELSFLKDKLGLSDTIVEKSAYIYRKAQEKRLIRGRTVLGILAAAIYIACRELGVPRTLKDIAMVSNSKPKEIAQDYRLLYFKLGLKVPITDPIRCVAMIASKAKVSETTTRHAINMMRNVIAQDKSAGKNPMGLAASVLYLSCLKYEQKGISQTRISNAAGITEVTLRNRCKELKKSMLSPIV